MTLSTRIAPHLPYLRRFSRALTGAQASGDAYVAATLEALIADVDIFPQTSSDRVGIYQLFCNLYKTAAIRLPELAPETEWERQSARNLSHVAPLPRQAFLLSSVENFTLPEAAEILAVDETSFSKLLAEASTEISKQISSHIMIIEDEPLIAMDIEQMVESLGHKTVGIARTKDEALALYETHKPQMILADIQLADGSSGAEAISEILQKDKAAVIFITAYPERLLTGKKPEPAFLITKPFNPDMVKALISQALFFQESAHIAA